MFTVHGLNSNTSSTNWRSAGESVPRAHRHFLPGKQKNGKQLVFEQNREIENKNRNKMRNGNRIKIALDQARRELALQPSSSANLESTFWTKLGPISVVWENSGIKG